MTTITLDVDNTTDVPDDLYEFLLDQFVAKALEQGFDIVNAPNLCLGNWKLTCEVEEVSWLLIQPEHTCTTYAIQ